MPWGRTMPTGQTISVRRTTRPSALSSRPSAGSGAGAGAATGAGAGAAAGAPPPAFAALAAALCAASRCRSCAQMGHNLSHTSHAGSEELLT